VTVGLSGGKALVLFGLSHCDKQGSEVAVERECCRGRSDGAMSGVSLVGERDGTLSIGQCQCRCSVVVGVVSVGLSESGD